MTPEESKLEPWQRCAVIPNTIPGSSHYGLNFACVKCGALVVRDEEISFIENSTIWSKLKLEFATVVENSEKFDEFKHYNYHDIVCEECHHQIGYYIKDPIAGLEGKISFPCSKILYLRKDRDGNTFHKTVLIGEKEEVFSSIEQLQLDSSSRNPSRSTNSL